MTPIVSIIMGNPSELPVMEEALKILNEFKIPFEISTLNADRVPEQVADFTKNAQSKGIRIIIAGASAGVNLPGDVAALTTIPVIGVPCRSGTFTDTWDSVLSILEIPAGIPVATVALDGGQNAGLLAIQILATGNDEILKKVIEFKENLKNKILKANKELAEVKFECKTN